MVAGIFPAWVPGSQSCERVGTPISLESFCMSGESHALEGKLLQITLYKVKAGSEGEPGAANPRVDAPHQY